MSHLARPWPSAPMRLLFTPLPGLSHRLPRKHLRSLADRPHGSPSGVEGPVFCAVGVDSNPLAGRLSVAALTLRTQKSPDYCAPCLPADSRRGLGAHESGLTQNDGCHAGRLDRASVQQQFHRAQSLPPIRLDWVNLGAHLAGNHGVHKRVVKAKVKADDLDGPMPRSVSYVPDHFSRNGSAGLLPH